MIMFLAIAIIILGIILFIPALLPIKNRTGFSSKIAILFVIIGFIILCFELGWITIGG